VRYVICFLFLLLTLIARISDADSVASTSSDPINNDIAYVNPDEHDNSYGYFIKRFDSYSVGTGNAYIYNDGAGTSSIAGTIKIRGMLNRAIQVDITNMSDAGTNTVGVFLANGTTTTGILWATDTETVYSGTQTGSINVSKPFDFIRVGVKRSGTSSADFTVRESYNRVAK